MNHLPVKSVSNPPVRPLRLSAKHGVPQEPFQPADPRGMLRLLRLIQHLHLQVHTDMRVRRVRTWPCGKVPVERYLVCVSTPPPPRLACS